MAEPGDLMYFRTVVSEDVLRDGVALAAACGMTAEQLRERAGDEAVGLVEATFKTRLLTWISLEPNVKSEMDARGVEVVLPHDVPREEFPGGGPTAEIVATARVERQTTMRSSS